MSETSVAVVGSGGREYELGRQLGFSQDIETVYFLDGNAGTDELPKGENVQIKPTAINEVVRFADEKNLGLTVIGPEAPLAAGLADRLREKGLAVFGPSAEAAQLEASKAYATRFMQENGIPHPPTFIAENYEQAVAFMDGKRPHNYVIKADGLTGGKGVILPKTSEEVEATFTNMFLDGGYDGAGRDVVLIQDRFHGPEVSVFVVSDGKRFVTLPYSQDHKRLLSGDNGPNTGGMGAYAPVPATIVSPTQELKIQDIAERSIQGMAKRGAKYQGVLYMGLMLAEELGGDPVVIEYNARFGDPETQAVLPLLGNAGVNVYDLLRLSAEGRLDENVIPSHIGGAALTVCLAAKGYPENPEKGMLIHGLDQTFDGTIIQHGGTKRIGSTIETSGGRVLYVTGVGETLQQAADNSYSAIGKIGFSGRQYRKDIGYQARSI